MNVLTKALSEIRAMTALAEGATALIAPDPKTLAALCDLDAQMLGLPQAEIRIDHLLHGGMYTRTAYVPAHTVVSGAVMRRATVLVINGDVTVFTGTDTVRLIGFHVLPGSAGRKQLFRAHTDTQLAMTFPTTAQTVEEAEREFTSEPELLMKSAGRVMITGETA